MAEEEATAERPAENALRDAYFGETHVHTAYSLDAYIGGTRLDHDGAYRYARGETVTVNGVQITRKRPLDFRRCIGPCRIYRRDVFGDE